MDSKKKYIITILKSIVSLTMIPNILILLLWIYKSDFAGVISAFFNAIILPILLLLSIKIINLKFQTNWWYINYPLILLLVFCSIYINFLGWAFSTESKGGFYGRYNIDKGTWMIIKTEFIFSIGIILASLFYHLISIKKGYTIINYD
ncbi:MAG: hypothetical protein V4548_06070 [Bacteroidota bacterium]